MKPKPLVFFVAASAFVASSCTQPAPPPSPVSAPQVDTVLVVDTVSVQVEAPVNAELESQLARLQLDLLERDQLVQGLEDQLGGTRQELVRTMAKLQSQATRAEAASAMAEAEIALGALERMPGGGELPEYQRAATRLAESTVAFNEENFAGAAYLAAEARTIARSGESRVGADRDGTLVSGESLFAMPLPLQTVSRSNVREGPGLDFPVLYTLDGGVELTGHSHTDEWVRILDDEGREGWIFHTLVGARPRGDEPGR